MKSKVLLFFVCCFLSSVMKAQTEPSVTSPVVSADSADNIIYDRAEVMPSYPGGVTELMKFISKNLVYPKDAREDGFQGKIIAKFTVDTDGSVVEPVILRDDGCDECGTEVIRVIKKFPKWTPGIQRDKPVKVYFTLPVNFRLDGESDLNNKEAIFKGDEFAFRQEMIGYIPKSIVKKKKDNFIETSIQISAEGTVTDVSIVNADTNDQSALEKIKQGLLNSNWYPAIKAGKKSASTHTMLFTF